MGNSDRAIRAAKGGYLVFEAVYFLAWLVTMIVMQIQVSGDASAEPIRLSHILLSLHFVVPIAAVALETEEGKELSGWQFFAVLAVLGTDLFSILESVLHLSSTVFPGYVRIQVAYAATGTGLTFLWLTWYTAAYFYYRASAKRKDAEDEETGYVPFEEDKKKKEDDDNDDISSTTKSKRNNNAPQLRPRHKQ